MLACKGGAVSLSDGENHEGPEHSSQVSDVFVDNAVQVGRGWIFLSDLTELCLKDEQTHHAVAQHNVLPR